MKTESLDPAPVAFKAEAVEAPPLEAPGIKITPRRGRPRSKKTSEPVEAAVVREEEDRQSSRASSPASTRPTSPSPEVRSQ